MDYLIKGESRETLDAQLVTMGLLIERDDLTMTATRVSVTGYDKAEIPEIWATKPVEVDGEIVTPGVEHSDYHANVRVYAGFADGADWGDVTVIDPTGIKTLAGPSWG